MATDEQYKELQRLVVALTERVHKLEEMAGVQRSDFEKESLRLQPLPDAARRPVEQHPQTELETKIGGQWLNRIGILAMLIGVSYFLKYAFDNDWIGPAARVVIGLASGLAVVFWSEHVRRTGYEIFSYSLKAIGIGVLYLSLWASSELYHLIPNALGFLAMIAVTAATASLAVWQDAEIVAGFAAVGAFITPVVLSSGVNNAAGLFGYLFILDIGALIVARYRSWIRVLIGSYAATLLLYSTWHARYYTTDQFSIAVLSVSAFFCAFALVPFVSARLRTSFGISLLALLNAATYFFQIWELFEHEAQNHQAAIAAVGLGCIYFLVAYQLRHVAPAVTTDIHWAIGAAFLIAAIPIGLDSPWITIGWFVEGAALIRMSGRTKTNYLKPLGAVALVLGTLRLFGIDHFEVSRLLFNERMLTFAIAIVALGSVARDLSAGGRDEQNKELGVVIVLINVLALVALTQEITDSWSRQALSADPTGARTLRIVRDFAYSALWMTYGAGLMLVGFWRKIRFLRWQALILIGITVGKVFIYDTSSLDRGYRIFSLIALGFLLLATSFLYQRSTRTTSGAVD